MNKYSISNRLDDIKLFMKDPVHIIVKKEALTLVHYP